MARIAYAASLALSVAILASLALPAAAATEKVLWSFKSQALGGPDGPLLFRGGALFGTGSGYGFGSGHGQVFKLINSGGVWKETSPLKFDLSDGSEPNGGLIQDSLGTLYGTTFAGDAYGSGNVFSLYKSGTGWGHETVWAFGGTSGDGAKPLGHLIKDSSGNLYGTTYEGGTYGYGTVFKLAKSGGVWTETVLWNFEGTSNRDGANPYAGLLLGESGVLYGTTAYGGDNDDGTVFELTYSGGVWTETVYSFTGGRDGANPLVGLIQGSKGGLYGTTYEGGAYDQGTVFELTQSGGAWTEKTLYSFAGGSDGANPDAALCWNGSGGLYGTTFYGGASGSGTVFALTLSGTVWIETVLYSFGGGPDDGATPDGTIILDKSGNLYGVTSNGGSYFNGTVWEFTP